jgi:phenylacetyl-CoA:acceptor oxidoreductase subunit 1
MTRWAMAVDLTRCVGCQTCTAACKQKNVTPPGVQWRRVIDLEVGEYPNVRRAFVPMGCMHCDDPPCMQVCPSTATGKCTFCVERIDFGLTAGLKPGVDPDATPACVNSCIAGAMHFGDADDPHSNISRLLAENQNFRMHEALGTGPNIHYLWDKAP